MSASPVDGLPPAAWELHLTAPCVCTSGGSTLCKYISRQHSCFLSLIRQALASAGVNTGRCVTGLVLALPAWTADSCHLCGGPCRWCGGQVSLGLACVREHGDALYGSLGKNVPSYFNVESIHLTTKSMKCPCMHLLGLRKQNYRPQVVDS